MRGTGPWGGQSSQTGWMGTGGNKDTRSFKPGGGDILNRNRKSPKRDLEGKMITIVLDSDLMKPICRSTDGWKKIIRSLLLRHCLATLNLLIVKYTVSYK